MSRHVAYKERTRRGGTMLCLKCRAEKPQVEFQKKQFWCRGCTAEARKKYRKQPGPRATEMVARSKFRAREIGVDFDLDKEWIQKRLEAGVCEATGIPFDMVTGATDKRRVPLCAPSVDRIDGDGGYTKDNCRITVWAFNRMRGDIPDDLFVEICRAVVEGK